MHSNVELWMFEGLMDVWRVDRCSEGRWIFGGSMEGLRVGSREKSMKLQRVDRDLQNR